MLRQLVVIVKKKLLLCSMKQIVIFGNSYQQGDARRVVAMMQWLRQHAIDVAVEREYMGYLQQQCGDDKTLDDVPQFDAEQVPQADVALSLGGDGTLLTTVMWVAQQDMPIMGINMGHLGYLTAARLNDAGAALEELLAGKCRIEERTMLQVSCDAADIPHPWALNDIAILRHDTSSMLDMETRLRGRDLTTYRGDGLVVSTPTGSTAYNMSVGGPIMEPTTACLVLSPISPHALTMRPLVVRDDSDIVVRTHTRATHYEVSIDGEVALCPTGSTVTIARAAHNARIIQRPTNNFARTLRHKLLWGTGQR